MRRPPRAVASGVATALLGLVGWTAFPAQAAQPAPQIAVSFGYCNACTLPSFGAATAPVSVPGEVLAPNSDGYNKFSFTDGSVELSMNGAWSTGYCCVNPDQYPGHNFNGWRLQFDAGHQVTGAHLTAFTPGGLTPEVTWTADSIYLNMWGAQLNQTFPVTLSFSTVAAPVPEPASLALWLAGLAGVGVVRASRRR